MHVLWKAVASSQFGKTLKDAAERVTWHDKTHFCCCWWAFRLSASKVFASSSRRLMMSTSFQPVFPFLFEVCGPISASFCLILPSSRGKTYRTARLPLHFSNYRLCHNWVIPYRPNTYPRSDETRDSDSDVGSVNLGH